MLIRWRLFAVALLAVLIAAVWCVLGPVRSATAAAAGFTAPLPPPLTVIGAFAPPAAPWLPGNRGVDLAASAGEPVFAAADGVVGYAGLLAGRGVVSVSQGEIRTTYEPVDVVVRPGDHVRQGQVIGRVAATADGCGPPGGCLHWGALRGDSYINPMSLLGSARIRLFPIWSDGLPTAPPAALTPRALPAPAPYLAGHQPTTTPTATATRTPAPTAAFSAGGGAKTRAAPVAVATTAIGLTAVGGATFLRRRAERASRPS